MRSEAAPDGILSSLLRIFSHHHYHPLLSSSSLFRAPAFLPFLLGWTKSNADEAKRTTKRRDNITISYMHTLTLHKQSKVNCARVKGLSSSSSFLSALYSLLLNGPYTGCRMVFLVPPILQRKKPQFCSLARLSCWMEM